jgi:hypothetical protein
VSATVAGINPPPARASATVAGTISRPAMRSATDADMIAGSVFVVFLEETMFLPVLFGREYAFER